MENDEEEQAAMGKAFREKYDLAVLFKEVFSTPEGARVLKHLRSIFIENVKFNPNFDPLKSIQWGFIREGQAMAVQYIEELIEFANQPQPTKDTEEVND